MSLSHSQIVLSKQERRVIVLSMQGLGDKEVAAEMGLSLGTVRTYWKRLQAKVGGNTRAETVAIFARSDSQNELLIERTLVEQLQAEIVQRREAEARFKAICACSPIGIYVTDLQGACLYVNPQWEKVTGFSASSVLAQQWHETVHPEDYDGLLVWFQRHINEGSPSPIDFRFVSNGKVIWVRTSFAPMTVDDQVIGYVGTIENAEERH